MDPQNPSNLSQSSAPSAEPHDLREKLIDAIAESLDGALFCNRVWSAWHVGTMGEDDFSSVSESDKPAELAELVLSIIGAAPLMANGPESQPIDIVLHCPACGLQHIDAPDHPYFGGTQTVEGFTPRWDNPPHRSHLCAAPSCGHIWRPADVPTNGVAAVKTSGKKDHPTVGAQAATASVAGLADPWRDAVIAELDCLHLTTAALEANPRDAIKALLHWQQTIALDPAVSSDAQALVERGQAEGVAPQAVPVPAHLDVRTILLDIVPGDGNGLEVFAKSVDNVVDRMTTMYERIEELEDQIARATSPAVVAPEPLFSLDCGKINITGAQSDWSCRPVNARRVTELANEHPGQVIHLYAQAVAPHPIVPLTQAAQDVLAERQRQISAEGWTPEHDDAHSFGELARAGAAYAAQSLCAEDAELECDPPSWWPWDGSWWKPSGRRRMLVKAGALILAEIERLDRAHGIPLATAAADLKGEAL